MSTEKIEIAILANKEICDDFQHHYDQLNEKSSSLVCVETGELLTGEIADFDFLYIDQSSVTDIEEKEIIDLCNTNNILVIKLIGDKSIEEYHIDYSHLIYPFNTKEVAVSIYLCSQKKSMDQTIQTEKQKSDEVLIGLANSNVRAILLNEALQKLRFSENVVSKKGGFLSYICDFLNSAKSIAGLQDIYFMTFNTDGTIDKLFNWENRIKDHDEYSEVAYIASEIHGECSQKREQYLESEKTYSFDLTNNDVEQVLIGVPIFVNKNLYGAIISLSNVKNETMDSSSNEYTLSLLISELEKSLERIVLSKKLSRKNLALFKTNSRLDFLLKSSPAILFNLSTNDNTNFEFISKNVGKLTGYSASEIMDDNTLYHSIIHHDDLPEYHDQLNTLASKHTCSREYRIKTKHGQTIWVHDELIAHCNEKGKITDIVGFLIDIDMRVKSREAMTKKNHELEEAYRNLQLAKDQLLQSDKLASIGQLAAGVAHEINNPVGYISSNLSSLNSYVIDLINIIDSIEEPLTEKNYEKVSEHITGLKEKIDYSYIKSDLPELLDQSLDGVKRVKRIVQDLKDFSHVDEEEWHYGDIHKGIDSTLNIVNNEIKYKADVVKEYGEIPEVECILSQLNQVFMNLLVNAAHAIKERGKITIKTWCDPDNVMVSISDTGKGIEKDSIKRLFDPFYTTKPVGEGTGLGLSLSYGIVERHHGKILVDSELGKGTTFTVRLPIIKKVVTETPQYSQMVSNE